MGGKRWRCSGRRRPKGGSIALSSVDLTVPGGMGGLELLAEIRKADAELPVFVARRVCG